MKKIVLIIMLILLTLTIGCKTKKRKRIKEFTSTITKIELIQSQSAFLSSRRVITTEDGHVLSFLINENQLLKVGDKVSFYTILPASWNQVKETELVKERE